MSDLFELGGFLLGLLFGSFLNVCISRLPAHESIIKPRSRCPQCCYAIRWYDNVPILSWILLRTRCRDCKQPISWRYPAVELTVGTWFLICSESLTASFVLSKLNPFFQSMDTFLSFWHNGGAALAIAMKLTIEHIGLVILGFLLIGLMVMDWQTQRLPDAFTLPGIVIGFLLTCMQAFFLAPGAGDIALNTAHQLRMSSPGSFAAQGDVFMTGTEALIWGRILAICGAALLLFTVGATYKALRNREGMGMGDVKLLAMITAFLGFGQTMLALFAGVIAASLYGTMLLVRRKANAHTRLPFGSFLCGGGLFAALFGPSIVSWYTNLLR